MTKSLSWEVLCNGLNPYRWKRNWGFWNYYTRFGRRGRIRPFNLLGDRNCWDFWTVVSFQLKTCLLSSYSENVLGKGQWTKWIGLWTSLLEGKFKAILGEEVTRIGWRKHMGFRQKKDWEYLKGWDLKLCAFKEYLMKSFSVER